MPDAFALDIDALLLPIDGPQPAGDRNAYPYRLREKLSDLRIEERAEDFDDATRPAQLKHADYGEIIRLGTAALISEAKDLRIACHLIEAWTKTAGFAGLRGGLCLLKRLVDECWDRLLPDIDDGDLDGRASPITNFLDDADRGFCFPNTVRLVPIVGGQSVLSWRKLTASQNADTAQEMARIKTAASGSALQEQSDAIQATITELTALRQVLDRRLEASAPSLTNLHKALEESALMAAAFLPQTPKNPAPAANATNQPTEKPSIPATAYTSSLNVGQLVGARDEVYAQLTQAAATLAQLEPHSPIPYLVRRAVELGKLPFPQLMQQLVREERILADLQREFGLQQSLST